VIAQPKGGTMFQVSEKASEMIKNYLKDKEENLAIRVMMQEGG
jgi:Fe-S cluster assembly iron-binding protein IscA